MHGVLTCITYTVTVKVKHVEYFGAHTFGKVHAKLYWSSWQTTQHLVCSCCCHQFLDLLWLSFFQAKALFSLDFPFKPSLVWSKHRSFGLLASAVMKKHLNISIQLSVLSFSIIIGIYCPESVTLSFNWTFVKPDLYFSENKAFSCPSWYNCFSKTL